MVLEFFNVLWSDDKILVENDTVQDETVLFLICIQEMQFSTMFIATKFFFNF